MLNTDWRSPGDYKPARSSPTSGLAWEYLRRFEDYHQDYRAISRTRMPSPRRLAAFSRRWGLRFPLRPRDTI